MKKIIITIMALDTMLSLTACGGNVTMEDLTESDIRSSVAEYISLTEEERETMKERHPEHYKYIEHMYETYIDICLD